MRIVDFKMLFFCNGNNILQTPKTVCEGSLMHVRSCCVSLTGINWAW